MGLLAWCPVLVLLSSLWFDLSLGHVSLRFPMARNYNLDFMDTFRTGDKCGMNKGTTTTTLSAGATIEVSWHLGYPHDGGYQLELHMDGEDPVVLRASDDENDGKTVQSHSYTFTDAHVCSNCFLRLVRGATEWGASYRFQSCADVEIVAAADYTEDCSGRGTVSGGSCSCTSDLYTGSHCQFKNDCDDDADCNNNGKCIDLDATNYPKKQCFCDAGFFGPTCDKTSSIETKDYDASEYMQIDFGSVKFLWKIVGDEYEGILEGKTDSYVAMGIRPEGTDNTCQAFPTDAPQPTDSTHHPMNCMDMIIGTAKGDRSRIEDYYTRDRSTPRYDSFFGGSSSLTAAFGWEADGKTVLRFKRKVKGDGKSDYDFGGKMTVIWAHGQDSSTNDFYVPDELKYHGPGNKGVGEYDLDQCPQGASCDEKPEPLPEEETDNTDRILLIVAVVLLILVLILQAAQNCRKGRLCC